MEETEPLPDAQTFILGAILLAAEDPHSLALKPTERFADSRLERGLQSASARCILSPHATPAHERDVHL